jgi:hypothetical protein
MILLEKKGKIIYDDDSIALRRYSDLRNFKIVGCSPDALDLSTHRDIHHPCLG